MSDSAKEIFIASTIELINSFRKKDPTIYLKGNCRSDGGSPTSLDGGRYWVMVVNNTRNKNCTPDIVGFCIHDCNGNRIAYGTSLYGNIDESLN